MADKTNHVSRRSVLKAAGGSLAAVGMAGQVSGKPDSIRVNVAWKNGRGRRAARNAADRKVREFDFGAMTIEMPRNAMRGLENNPNVRYVEADGEMQAIKPIDAKKPPWAGGGGGGGGSTGEQLPWGVDRVDANVAHANGDTGQGAHIAILDTGIDSDHPDLQANVGSGRSFVKCKGKGCNYDWDDDEGHGTHCAGSANAVDNDQGVIGVSTDATLHAVKVLDKRGSGSFSDIAAGIQYVANQGWDVASMSLGASSGSQTIKDACTYAYDAGVLLVAAAGNSGPCTDCVGYPAAYPECVAVSSTNESDGLSSFSSTGPQVEIAAPGSNIYSTYKGGGYDTLSGTSMATPHVSGAAGQLMAGGMSNTQARDALTSTAEDLGLPANEQGAGLLDVAAALGLDSSEN